MQTYIFTPGEVAMAEHELFIKIYNDGGLKGMEEYLEGVLDMAQSIIEIIDRKVE